jgi:hypothetical protein
MFTFDRRRQDRLPRVGGTGRRLLKVRLPPFVELVQQLPELRATEIRLRQRFLCRPSVFPEMIRASDPPHGQRTQVPPMSRLVVSNGPSSSLHLAPLQAPNLDGTLTKT